MSQDFYLQVSILEDCARSPKGFWYPTRVRNESSTPTPSPASPSTFRRRSSTTRSGRSTSPASPWSKFKGEGRPRRVGLLLVNPAARQQKARDRIQSPGRGNGQRQPLGTTAIRANKATLSDSRKLFWERPLDSGTLALTATIEANFSGFGRRSRHRSSPPPRANEAKLDCRSEARSGPLQRLAIEPDFRRVGGPPRRSARDGPIFSISPTIRLTAIARGVILPIDEYRFLREEKR